MTATIARKNRTVKEPSIEKLAKQKARGANGHKLDYRPPTLSEDLARQMRQRALKLADDAVDRGMPREDRDFLYAISRGQEVTPADVARFAMLSDRAAGVAVRGNGHAKVETSAQWTDPDAELRRRCHAVINSPLKLPKKLKEFLIHVAGNMPLTDDDRIRIGEVLGECEELRDAQPVAENGKPKNETKPAKRETKAAAGETLGPVVKLKVADLVRHPKNRRVTGEAIDERAESMAESGQLEPIIVRTRYNGSLQPQYQILSGETRWLAARKLEWTEIDARLRECNDQEAFDLVGIANGQRKDLNPIERAQLIEQYCLPIAEGGNGLTKDAAAKRVGLKDGSSASNLVRLLKLPKVWQDRVASGELPESFARLLCRFADAPKLMDQVEVSWTKAHNPKTPSYQRNDWDTRDDLEQELDHIFQKFTRPVDGKTKHRYGWPELQRSQEEPPLFELTDKLRKDLEIRTIEFDGKPLEVATNVKLFDKLQLPLVKKKHPDSVKKSTPSTSRSASNAKAGPPKKLSPAQLAKQAEQEAKELQRDVEDWRLNWIRELIAEALVLKPDVHARLLVWFASAPSDADGYAAGAEQAMVEEAKRHGAKVKDRFDGWAALATMTGAKLQACANAVIRAWILPNRVGGPSYCALDDELIETLAVDCGVDLPAAWAKLQGQKKDPRLKLFFDLFSVQQLDRLGEDLGVHVGMAKTKDGKVKLLTTRDRALKLPKCIKPLAAGRAAKSQAGKKTSRRGAKAQRGQ